MNGVEISTLWENHEIHIVGLNIDIAYPTMTALLEEQKARRQQRGQMIAERPEKARIPGARKGRCDWRTVAPSPAAILPVFWLRPAMRKHGGSLQKYLARGKTGYVPPQWCTIKQAIDVIHHSGGKAVIAHPGRYDLSAKWLKRLLAHFSEQGGDAMEVAQCQQAPHERAQLATGRAVWSSGVAGIRFSSALRVDRTWP